MALPTSSQNNVTVRQLANTLNSYNNKLTTKFSGKADKVANATSGNLAALDGNGNLTDSGKKAADFATLDASGKVPSSQLPSYVDDVIEGYYYNSKFYKEAAHTTEITPEDGKIYVDLPNNRTYRWSGSQYTLIATDLTLGETSTTAYRGDRGKTAYDHSQTSGNPHGTTKADLGLGNVDNKSEATIKSDFTGSVTDGNTGFPTGDMVYDAISANGKGFETITLENTYAEVTAILNAGKIPVLVEQETGSGRTLYYAYCGMRSDAYVFNMSENVATYLPGGTEPISTNVNLFIQYLSPTGWHWSHATSEDAANKVASWDAADPNGYKYPTAKLVKDSLDQKAAASHAHGNITNDGKIGSTADLSVVTTTGGAVITANLTTDSPSAGTGTAIEFIDTVSQNSRGKITATKKRIRGASASNPGIVQLATSIGATVSTENSRAATEKAVRDALDAQGTGVEFITLDTTYSEIAAIIAANRTPILQVPFTYEGTVVGSIYAYPVQANSTEQGSYMFSAVIGEQVLAYVRPGTGDWVTYAYTPAKLNQVVRYDTNAQGLTDTQKENARTNISAAASNHTHTTTLATSSGTSTITLEGGKKYQLGAGGTSVIFTMSEMTDQEITDIIDSLT